MRLRASRLAQLAGLVALLAGFLAAPAAPAVAASSPQTPPANPYSPAYGHPYRHGVVPTIATAKKMHAYEQAQASTTASSSNTLSYGGGIDGIGVTSGTPKVYLVFWGSQWGTQGTDGNGDLTFTGDYDNGAPYIQEMFKGLGTGSELWSGTMTQYCDGSVGTGATTCPAGSAHVGFPLGGALAGVWFDNSSAEPQTASDTEIGQEAVAAAAHFGNTTAASNRYAQYFVLSSPGTDPDGYQSPRNGFCAWHDYSGDSFTGGPVTSPYGDVAFTNMPYLMDVGSACGQGYVNSPGTLDGYSIVAGHEYAETLTDQNPAGGWTSASGNEDADECAWGLNNGPSADVTMATGSFAMQSTWSNDTNQCALSHPDGTMTILSGNSQSATVQAVYGALEVNVTDPYGNPVTGLSVTFTAPTSGPTATFGSPCSGSRCVVATDSKGNATSPALTAGTTAGSFSVSTSAVGVATPSSFSLDNLAGNPSKMVLEAGNSQSAAVGTAYGTRLEVKVTDSFGNVEPGVSVALSAPSSGASVTFASCTGGNPQPYECTVSTDSNGNATSSVVTANTTTGAVAVSAVSGAASTAFSLTNIAGSAVLVSVVGGSGQQALAAGGFASPLSVKVIDGNGNPVAGAQVTFSTPSGGPTATFAPCAGGNPTVNQCVVVADANGVATSSALAAGTAAGPFSVTAAVTGALSVPFQLTNLQSGYYLVASDGGVFAYGGAPFDGSQGGQHLNAPIVGMAVAPGGGYYLVASDGGIFALGGAPFYGSHGGSPLNEPIVGMAVAPGGGGYYLVASDGGIFNYGPGAVYYGSHGGSPLNEPIVGMAVAPGGYYLVASDGGIFNYGPGAVYYGSHGGSPLNKPIVGMSVDPATGGYWLDASDGGIFNYNAPFYGSTGGAPINAPMVGVAPSALPVSF